MTVMISAALTAVLSASLGMSQSGLQKFAADLTIRQAFENALHRQPDDAELRRYRVRFFEDHWNARDIEDDLSHRSDYWSHDDRRSRDREDGGYDVDRMIRHAYQDILGRAPDAEGMRTYRSNVIDRGHRRWRSGRNASPSSPAPALGPEIVVQKGGPQAPGAIVAVDQQRLLQCAASGYGPRMVRKADGTLAPVGLLGLLRIPDAILQDIPANRQRTADCW